MKRRATDRQKADYPRHEQDLATVLLQPTHYRDCLKELAVLWAGPRERLDYHCLSAVGPAVRTYAIELARCQPDRRRGGARR